MNKDNERITYDEFMMMFKIAPSMCYTLYEKAEDEIENLQKKAEHQKQMIKSQYGTIKSINKTSQNRKEAIKSLLVQNEKLKKKAELGDHYKHLYSEVKKQKGDVVEYIKKNNLYHIEEHTITPQSTTSYIEVERYIVSHKKDLLRMLGEIDD